MKYHQVHYTLYDSLFLQHVIICLIPYLWKLIDYVDKKLHVWGMGIISTHGWQESTAFKNFEKVEGVSHDQRISMDCFFTWSCCLEEQTQNQCKHSLGISKVFINIIQNKSPSFTEFSEIYSRPTHHIY